MRDVETIDKEIEEVKRRMASVEGTPTEVYTRIVGYYRSLTNWNKGKREEYNKRQTFEHTRSRLAPRRREPEKERVAELQPAGTPVAATAQTGGGTETEGRARTGGGASVLEEAAPRAGGIASYAYFFRHSCPNCPPVRALLERSSLSGRHYDVDTDEGYARASDEQILATPTVIFFEDDGRTVGRATAPGDVQAFLSAAE